MILDFFPENTLGDGPKNSRIRVKIHLKISIENKNTALNPYLKDFGYIIQCNTPGNDIQKTLMGFDDSLGNITSKHLFTWKLDYLET